MQGPGAASLAFATAIAARDPEAAVVLWLPDAVMVGADGSAVRGRDALLSVFRALTDRGVTLEIAVDVALVAGDLALAETRMTMRSPDAEPLALRGSVVYAHTPDGWRIAIDRVSGS